VKFTTASLARPAVTAKFAPPGTTLLSRPPGRRTRTLAAWSGRAAKSPAVAPVRRKTTAFAAIVRSRTISPFGRSRFFLTPLRAKAEALQLAQVEFVEIRGRIFLGSVVVHIVQKKRAVARVVC
jgi:hypothetical protein